MTINHEKKLIFIHIPKNAGTSIIKFLCNDNNDNIFIDKNIIEYKKHYKNYWEEYLKFTVIRDPVSRFISTYKFSRMRESGWFSATGKESLPKHSHYDICNSMNINEYASYIYNNPDNLNIWTIPQSFIILNDKNKIEIDYFVRYESLLEDLKKIGINKIDKLNSSKIEDESQIQLTKKTISILHNIYDIDYQNFCYKKELNHIFSYN